ncbi:MAG: hypothetical protein JRI91_00355 [Deltaproteobacteria bacterium]|nr:hypothetical protein [Deltaproteobacteria bacterium]
MPEHLNLLKTLSCMIKKLIIIAVAFFLCSCSMQQHYSKIDTIIKSGECDRAVDLMAESKSSYGNNARLIFLMDSAMVHLECGNYDQANKFFHEAEALGEKLWTESLSRHAISFVSNDLVLPYAGEDFERALINLFSALCYLRVGEYDEALVECRRLDTLLSGYNTEYNDKNIYKEDAFGRYISGLIHEAAGELDDAYIDYYNAFMVYSKDYTTSYNTSPPSFLAEDLLRTADKVDRFDEAKRLVPNYLTKKYRPEALPKNTGKVVLIHLNGKSPVKKENKIVVPTPSGPIGIAFPKYVVNTPECRSSRLILKSGSKTFKVNSEIAQNINSIAVKSLDDRKVRVIAKTIARAVAKQLAIKTISAAATDKHDKSNRRLVEFFLNTANTLLLERADTRTWRTLPGEIYICRIFVPEGDYTAYIKKCGGTPAKIEQVRIKAGETRFLLFNSIY